MESETAAQQPLWNIWSDVHQVAENYYYKQLYRTSPIAIYMIVKPNTATPIHIPSPLRTLPHHLPVCMIWTQFNKKNQCGACSHGAGLG